MAEQFLDHSQVRAAVEQVSGEAVPERVGRDALRQAGGHPQAIQAPANATRAQGGATVVEEHDPGVRWAGVGPRPGVAVRATRPVLRARRPPSQHRTAFVDVHPQRRPSRPPQQGDALLSPLAGDSHLAPAQVHRTDAERRQLSDPEPRGIGRLHDRDVA